MGEGFSLSFWLDSSLGVERQTDFLCEVCLVILTVVWYNLDLSLYSEFEATLSFPFCSELCTWQEACTEETFPSSQLEKKAALFRIPSEEILKKISLKRCLCHAVDSKGCGKLS